MNHHHKISYTCPMHPEITRGKPGMCPECGMQLVKHEQHTQHTEVNHDKHAGHHTESFITKFWVTLLLTIPIFLYSDLMEVLFGWTLPQFKGYQYFVLVLGTIVFFYGGKIFLTSARRELAARVPGMMTLIAIAISTAYIWSVVSVLLGRPDTLFWELGSLIAIMLLGHWIEMRSVKGAKGALDELAKLLPDEALLEKNGEVLVVTLSELKEGDVVLVKPGMRVPVDGIIIGGISEVNESFITGESRPISKTTKDEVLAGSINGDGSLRVQIEKLGEHTFLAGVMRLVEEAQSSKSRLQMLSDRAAFYLTIIAIVVGVITFTLWIVLGDSVVTAVERLVAVLVIACPHALGLAVPLISSISTSKAARSGLLIKDRLALEEARNISAVLFDKTGTLTQGVFGVDKVLAVKGSSEKDILAIAASVNSHSEHLLADAIVSHAKNLSLTFSTVKGFERIPGKGVKGILNKKETLLGNKSLFKEHGVGMSKELQPEVNRLSSEGKTVVHLSIEGKHVGSVSLSDKVKKESRIVIEELRKRGIKTAMITGDSEDVARFVANEIGIDEYFAGVLPGEKQSKVKEIQQRGESVAMVGDGVNDAPALTQADVGIAIGAGTNVAIESAGIVLIKDDPQDILKVIDLSKTTYRKMIQNLWWATGYNIFALPLAAGALAWKGIVLEPAFAAVLMSVSTVIVSLNALLFRRTKI